MRKTLIAALTALTALALAAVAIAQTPPSIGTVTATISPDRRPVRRRSRSRRRVNLTINNNKEEQDLGLQDRDSRSRRPSCSRPKGPEDLLGRQSSTRRATPAGLPRSRPSAPPRRCLNANVGQPGTAELQRSTTFVAGKNLLAFYLGAAQPGSGLRPSSKALEPAKITKVSGRQGLRPEAHDQHPGEPAAARPGRVLDPDPDQELARPEVRHATRSSKSIGCPKLREQPIGVKVSYVPNPNPPAASSASSTDGATLLRQGPLGLNLRQPEVIDGPAHRRGRRSRLARHVLVIAHGIVGGPPPDPARRCSARRRAVLVVSFVAPRRRLDGAEAGERPASARCRGFPRAVEVIAGRSASPSSRSSCTPAGGTTPSRTTSRRRPSTSASGSASRCSRCSSATCSGCCRRGARSAG